MSVTPQLADFVTKHGDNQTKTYANHKHEIFKIITSFKSSDFTLNHSTEQVKLVSKFIIMQKEMSLWFCLVFCIILCSPLQCSFA